jgi:hypothetical protein
LGAGLGHEEWSTYLPMLRLLSTLPPVDSLWQVSLAALWFPLAIFAAVGVALVVALAGRRPAEAHLARSTALGLGLLLVPGSSWFHWVTFTSAPLLLEGHRFAWSRRLLLGLLAASWLIVPLGSWATTAVASAALAGLCWRLVVLPSPAPPSPAPVLPARAGGAHAADDPG